MIGWATLKAEHREREARNAFSLCTTGGERSFQAPPLPPATDDGDRSDYLVFRPKLERPLQLLLPENA